MNIFENISSKKSRTLALACTFIFAFTPAISRADQNPTQDQKSKKTSFFSKHKKTVKIIASVATAAVAVAGGFYLHRLYGAKLYQTLKSLWLKKQGTPTVDKEEKNKTDKKESKPEKPQETDQVSKKDSTNWLKNWVGLIGSTTQKICEKGKKILGLVKDAFVGEGGPV